MKPILSICIPTYNRYEILKKSLQNKIEAFEKFNIELCISNNSSTDETKEYIESLQKSFKCIKFYQQPFNKGIDQNMVDVMLMATGKFLLPIGDDQEIRLEYLEKMFNLLESEPDLLILNGILGDNEHLSTSLKKKVFFEPLNSFAFLWDKLPFGSFIVKKDILTTDFYKKFLGTSHAYTGWVWEYLLKKFKDNGSIFIYCASDPIINFRKEDKSWKENFFKIMFYEIPLWFHLLKDDFPVIKKNRILDNYLKSLTKINNLLEYRANGSLTKENINAHMSFFSTKQIKLAKQIEKIPIKCMPIYTFTKKIIRKLFK